jgi:hypothetical protein
VSRKRYFGLCMIALAGAFAGSYAASAVSNYAVSVVHAQVIGLQNIRAAGFTLVDPQGKVQATLRGAASGAELVLDDGNGKSRVEIGASGGIVVRDANGRVTWASPRSFGVVPARECQRKIESS